MLCGNGRVRTQDFGYSKKISNFLWISSEFPLNFVWISPEIYLNFFQISSIRSKFFWILSEFFWICSAFLRKLIRVLCPTARNCIAWPWHPDCLLAGVLWSRMLVLQTIHTASHINQDIITRAMQQHKIIYLHLI